MTSMIRLLTNKDYNLFEEFLKNHASTSMFMRSNVKRVGLEFQQGQDFSAHYWGAFDKEGLKGVIALNWNGNLFIQAPEDDVLLNLFEIAKQEGPQDFALKGILGPVHQSQQILSWFNPLPSDILISRTETVYSLALENMTLPSQLLKGSRSCRLATEKDLDILVPWRLFFEVETMNVDRHQTGILERIHHSLSHQITRQESFILEDQGICVAKADYNATLPDIYQIGGVWTPPEFRGRGYARGAVAGALLAAHDQGVKFGILFTRNPTAMRAYESLGFKKVDDYHITLFKESVPF